MLRKALISLMLCLLSLGAGAQLSLPDPTALRLENERAWMTAAGNPAGLVTDSLKAHSSVGLRYLYGMGEYRLLPDGKRHSDIAFDTEGAVKVGKVNLWGHFAYNYIATEGSSYNTLLFNPYDTRFLYSVADSVESGWRRQAYDLEFKAAMPLSRDKLFGGLHVTYTDRIAAKQNDPRAESYHYSVGLTPSLIFRGRKGNFGFHLHYANTFERSTPTLSNTEENQMVYVLRGLGNYIDNVVGGNSMKTMYFRCNTLGAGLQYEGTGRTPWLLYGNLRYHLTNITEGATQPRLQGRTNLFEADLGWKMRLRRGHRVSLAYSHSGTTGIEPTTVMNMDGIWEVLSELPQCSYSKDVFALSWDKTVGSESDWKWVFHAGLSYVSENDTYANPHSVFSWSALRPQLSGEWRQVFRGGSALRLGLELGGAKSLSSLYQYEGGQADGKPAAVWYPHDLSILAADYVQQALSLGFTLPLRRAALQWDLRARGTETFNGLYRLWLEGGFSVFF